MHDTLRPRLHTAVAFLLIGVALAAGCRPKSADPSMNANVEVTFDPSPPATGVTGLNITLADSSGQPMKLGHLDVEGNMNHAGMKPVFARLEETEPGRYAGKIEFTMGGDWFLLLSGTSASGGLFTRKVDVPGVKPQ